MSIVSVQAWHCDTCGFEWMKYGDRLPQRCANPERRCRNWNHSAADDPAASVVVEQPASSGTPRLILQGRCTQAGHVGFQRADGWWCITCRRMY